MNNNSGNKQKTQKKYKNFLESLKDMGSATQTAFKNEASAMSEDLMRQLLGASTPEKRFGGEIKMGQEVILDDVYSGKHEDKLKMQNQLAFERKIHLEDKESTERKQGELKMELRAIKGEIDKIAQALPELDSEVKVAADQIASQEDIDTYHIFFLHNILKFVKSFRKKIENASIWLAEANKRSAKKRGNWVQNYKNQGAKYLLSGEHYLSRSAG